MKAIKQLQLNIKTRGRPLKKGDISRTSSGKIAHIPRPNLNSKTPVHINIKVRKDIPNLRRKSIYKMLKIGVKKARIKGLKVIHFALVSNHLHLIIEADGNKELAQGMRSFLISFAMNINNSLKRRGSLFVDRYNMEVIKVPRRMRYLLSYVFKNNSQHQKRKFTTDPYSSLITFSDQDVLFGKQVPILFDPKAQKKLKHFLRSFLSPPESWLATIGWKISNSSMISDSM